MGDVFREQFLDASYASLDGSVSVAFPAGECSIEDGHDLAEHAAYRRPGVDLEPTGRVARRGRIVAELWNDLGEGDLFPSRYTQLIQVLGDNPIGRLTHPVYGPIVVGAKAWPHSFKPGERSGVSVPIEWVEHNASISDVIDFRGAVATDTPTTATQQAGAADAAMTAAAPAGGFTPVTPTVVAQLAAIEGSALSYAQVTASINAMAAVITANLALPIFAAASAHPAVAALEALRATVYALRSRYLPEQSRTWQYTVPSTMADWQVALEVYRDASKASLIRLANRLADPSFIPAGTLLTILPSD